LSISHKRIKPRLRIKRIGKPNPKKEKNQVRFGLTKGDRYANTVNDTRRIFIRKINLINHFFYG